jgi:hypothetical protein
VLRHALPALRHRVLLNFEGLGAGLRTDELVLELIERSGTGAARAQ